MDGRWSCECVAQAFPWSSQITMCNLRICCLMICHTDYMLLGMPQVVSGGSEHHLINASSY